jgi:hypothetical protein
MSSRPAHGSVVFPKLSKLLNQEDALSVPAYEVICSLRRRALAGRRNAADRLSPSLLWHITVGYTESSCGQALMLSRRWAAMHGQSATGARPNRAVVARRR